MQCICSAARIALHVIPNRVPVHTITVWHAVDNLFLCCLQWLIEKLAEHTPSADFGRYILATTANAVQGSLTIPFPLLAFYVIHGSDNFISHDFTPFPHFLYSKCRQASATGATATTTGVTAVSHLGAASAGPAAAMFERIDAAVEKSAGGSEVEVLHEEVPDGKGNHTYVSALDDYIFRSDSLAFLPPFYYHMWVVKEKQDSIFSSQQHGMYHGSGTARFGLQSQHPQACTHMLRLRPRPVIPMWLHGLPTEIPSDTSPATEQDAYAAFVLGCFASDRVWRTVPGEPGAVWTQYKAWLADNSCPFHACTKQVLNNLEAYLGTRRAQRQRSEVRAAALKAAQELADRLRDAGIIAAPHPLPDDMDSDDDMQVR